MATTVHPSDPPLAIPRVWELCSGVDALYLSGRAELSEALFEVLEERRTTAELAEEPVPLSLAGSEFFVEPRSFGKYRFRLVHPSGLVGVTASDHLPSLRVQPRAEFLHGVGPLAALDFFNDVGEYLAGGRVEWSLSRLDLFTDVQGWDPARRRPSSVRLPSIAQRPSRARRRLRRVRVRAAHHQDRVCPYLRQDTPG